LTHNSRRSKRPPIIGYKEGLRVFLVNSRDDNRKADFSSTSQLIRVPRPLIPEDEGAGVKKGVFEKQES